jgi:1-acyl-sn-glycerol-3-phosphate acyltransferase
MKLIARLGYQLYKWLIFLPLTMVVTFLCALFAVIFSLLVSQRVGNLVGGVYWSRIIGFITPMRVTVRGAGHIDPLQSYIIVSNHQSTYDIFLLYGWLGIDFRWIMKKELRNIFAIGYASEKVGHIFIDRSSPKAAYLSLEEAKRKLVNGTSVVIFPEGTRTNSNKLGRFKRGASKMAFDLNLPILPITIIDTHKVMGSGFLNINPGKVQLIIHPVVNIEAFNGQEDALMDHVRSTIAAAIPGEV